MKKSTNPAKLSRAAYMREWRKKNPEKAREYVERYWAKRAEKEKRQKEKKEEE